MIVELGMAFDLLNALHEFHVALEQRDILLLLFVEVQRVVLLHRVPCLVCLVVRTWH